MAAPWFDITYMGKRQKRYFKLLDKMLLKLFKQAAKQEGTIQPELFDQIIKLTGRQNTTSTAISKMYADTLSEERYDDMRFLLEQVPAEALRKAAEHPRWKNRNWAFNDGR